MTETDETNQTAEAVQKSYADASRFNKVVKLKGFKPFTSAQEALDNIMAVSENEATDFLKSFLEQNLPKVRVIKGIIHWSPSSIFQNLSIYFNMEEKWRRSASTNFHLLS